MYRFLFFVVGFFEGGILGDNYGYFSRLIIIKPAKPFDPTRRHWKAVEIMHYAPGWDGEERGEGGEGNAEGKAQLSVRENPNICSDGHSGLRMWTRTAQATTASIIAAVSKQVANYCSLLCIEFGIGQNGWYFLRIKKGKEDFKM